MFKRIALLSTLALAASGSIAMASPDHPFAARSTDRFDGFDRDRFDADRAGRDRFERGTWNRGRLDDFGARRYRSSWVALSGPLRLGRIGRDAIEVNDPGTFTQLRLQAQGGAVRVSRVIIEFADGSRQVAQLGRVLDQRDELIEIPLDGNNRRIDRILVVGATGRRAAIEVFGI